MYSLTPPTSKSVTCGRLIQFGERLFTVNWTVQEGAGGPYFRVSVESGSGLKTRYDMSLSMFAHK
jgi:hypothetical protein